MRREVFLRRAPPNIYCISFGERQQECAREAFQGMARNIWLHRKNHHAQLTLSPQTRRDRETDRETETHLFLLLIDVAKVSPGQKDSGRRTLTVCPSVEVLEQSARQTKRKTSDEEDRGDEDSPSERDTRDKRVRMNNSSNKIEKESEQSEFTNHEEEVRVRTWSRSWPPLPPTTRHLHKAVMLTW